MTANGLDPRGGRRGRYPWLEVRAVAPRSLCSCAPSSSWAPPRGPRSLRGAVNLPLQPPARASQPALPRCWIRHHRQALPRPELLHLPRQEEAGERSQPRVVRVERVARRASRSVGRGRGQASARRDAAARRRAAARRAAPGRGGMAGPRVGAHRCRDAAGPRPGDGAPPEPHRVQQHDQGTARRRRASRRRLPAGRFRVRLRQHRRRALALAGADGEVRVGRGPRRAGRALRTAARWSRR